MTSRCHAQRIGRALWEQVVSRKATTWRRHAVGGHVTVAEKQYRHRHLHVHGRGQPLAINEIRRISPGE